MISKDYALGGEADAILQREDVIGAAGHRPLAEADDLTEILAWRSPAADTVQPHVLMQPNVAP